MMKFTNVVDTGCYEQGFFILQAVQAVVVDVHC